MAQNYECVLLLKPTLSDEAVQNYQDQFSKIITDGGGEVAHVQRSAKRRLEYVIRKQREAFFVVFYFRAEKAGPIVQEFERQVRINDELLREMTQKVPELRVIDITKLEAVPITSREEHRRARQFGRQSYQGAAEGTPAEAAAPAAEATEAGAVEASQPSAETAPENA